MVFSSFLRENLYTITIAVGVIATYVSKEDHKSQLILYAEGHIIFSNVLANKNLFQIL